MVVHRRAVDVNGAALDPVGEPQAAVDVLREDGRRQAVLVVVGVAQRLLVVAEGEDRKDGRKHLLAVDAHVVRHVAQEARLDDVALALVLAGGDLGTLREGVLDGALDALGARRRRVRPTPEGSRP